MPKPVIGPCGGPGQPACPPTPAAQVNVGDVLETPDGQKHHVYESVENVDERGEDGQ